MYLSRSIDDVDDPTLRQLINALIDIERDLNLDSAIALVGFPTYKDAEDESVKIPLLILSEYYGAVLFNVTSAVRADSDGFLDSYAHLNHAYNCMSGRLMRNNKLTKGRMGIATPLLAVLYAPHLDDKPTDEEIANDTLTTTASLRSMFESNTTQIDSKLFYELVSTTEGSKALDQPKKRNLEGQPETSRGMLAQKLESEIRRFDQEQRRSFAVPMIGPERIRGLAGSGKTVVLAMKAAKTHFENPDAQILYTFWTRSLYQHVRSLILRFSKMFSEQPPDWNKLQIMHGWGASDMPGVYRTLCTHYGRNPVNFTDASKLSKQPFDYLCIDLASQITPEPLFDFVFIDEGQDFPSSFVRLVSSMAKDQKFAIAYDELQTIFQPKCPSESDIFGTDEKGEPKGHFIRDEVLKTCYRNPSEILVVAHAIGFGVYLKKKTQMFKTELDWEEIGYKVQNPPLESGKAVWIERLARNSLDVLSRSGQTKDDIVRCEVKTSPTEEAEHIAASIREDLSQGLLPDDIMVVTVDDAFAKNYLNLVGKALNELDIASNNVHVASGFGERDFHIKGQITLTTVHKAKGNEAYVVYIAGADAAALNIPKNRNMLFTAITRAKGWVRISGVGAAAEMLCKEVNQAKHYWPCLAFKYPAPEEIMSVSRDLQRNSTGKTRIERELMAMVTRARTEMTHEEIQDVIESGLHTYSKQEQFGELQED